MTPTVGRIVHYRLAAHQAEEINRRRTGNPHGPQWPAGAQAHVGNRVTEGETLPLIVVRDNGGSINGQVLLDGNDSLWVTSATEGTGPGTWSWPPRTP